MKNNFMKAVVLTKSCDAEEMKITEIEIPKVKDGWVLIKVKAFGLNHSEIILRRSEVNEPYINTPIVPGIECVGEVIDPSNSKLKLGQRVIALMGGMGRSFNGSYAEFALLPINNVFSINSDLDWTELAAIPETFFTAYGSLFDCLQIKSTDILLIRGGTSALGIASAQLAKSIGCKVLATALDKEKYTLLRDCGVDIPLLDDGTLKEQIKDICPEGVTKILELVGPSTLEESMKFLSYHGIVCSTGILGGKVTLDNFDPIKQIPNGRYLTSFYSNYPTQEKIDEMFKHINKYNLKPIIGRKFAFEKISEAHLIMEQKLSVGKNVVYIEEK